MLFVVLYYEPYPLMRLMDNKIMYLQRDNLFSLGISMNAKSP